MTIIVDEITKLAYLMEEAYRETDNKKQAINYLLNHEKAKKLIDTVSVATLEAMWQAIDAYVDVNRPITAKPMPRNWF